MSQSISIGLDFGSLKYRAAYTLEGTIVPVPVPAGEMTWVGSVMLQPTRVGGLTFSSLKHQLGTGQPMTFRGARETIEDVVRDHFLDIKRSVEEYAGENIGRTVISVPANYPAFRRAEVVKIAESAGLGKITLINDCTAAALDYTFDLEATSSTFLVYSMGFIGAEVSLLRVVKGRLREVAHESADLPSGRDFDVLLMASCVDLFKRQGTPLPTKTYRNHWFDLRIIAAEAKHQLTVSEETTLSLPTYITGTEPQNIPLRRDDFEQSIAQDIQISMGWIDEILENANLHYADIDRVLLVGGSTRINYIQRLLEERFGPKLIQPRDEVLARGAAVQAFKLTDEEQNSNHLLIETVLEVPSEEAPPISIAEGQPVQRQEVERAEEEQELQETVEISSGDTETLRLEVDLLFDYAQELMDSGNYEEADEFLKEILGRVESARRELKGKWQEQQNS